MDKIKKISLCFRILFQVFFAALPLFLFIAWIKPSNTGVLSGIVDVSYIPAGYIGNILNSLSIFQRLLALSAGCLPLFIQLYILYSLIQLFKLYEHGMIFSIDNVRYIRNIGYALIGTQIINALYQALMGFILTWHNPPGHRFSSVTLDQANIGVILIALIVILISWIMLEGCKIREEQQLTI